MSTPVYCTRVSFNQRMNCLNDQKFFNITPQNWVIYDANKETSQFYSKTHNVGVRLSLFRNINEITGFSEHIIFTASTNNNASELINYASPF